MTRQKVLNGVLAIIAAVILLQTLYFKFTAQPESVELFRKLGAEPYGRITSGILELITGIFLLFPLTRQAGAILGAGIMSGAIASHIFVLGIESQGDGGQLFLLACIVLICCLILAIPTFKRVFVRLKRAK